MKELKVTRFHGLIHHTYWERLMQTLPSGPRRTVANSLKMRTPKSGWKT